MSYVRHSDPLENSLYSAQSESRMFKVWTWIGQASRFLVNQLVRRNEPKIHQTINRQGTASWKVYDPITEQTSYFDSEQNVRQWIENRYYS